ncbi:MAG: hypothetical protein QXH07_04990 [Thermoplasmata archaeon]
MTTNLLQANYKKTNIGQCSTYNNGITYTNESIICPSQCPYKSFYDSYYSNGRLTIEPVVADNLPGFECLSSPVTTSTTSTISVSSTTTIPQIKYYHLNIIRTPNLSQSTQVGLFVYCWPNPQPDNNYSEQANSQVSLSTPASCILPQTGVEYYFSKWGGTGTGSINTTSNFTTIIMKNNITETAYYISTTTTIPSTTTISNSKPTYYTLRTIVWEDGGNVSQSGSGIYINGSEVKISAMPARGYIFGRWMCIIGNVTSLQGELGVVCKNVGYSGNSPNVTILLNSNITEIAFFGIPAMPQKLLTINSNPPNIG